MSRRDDYRKVRRLLETLSKLVGPMAEVAWRKDKMDAWDDAVTTLNYKLTGTFLRDGKVLWLDGERCYTPNERQLDCRIDAQLALGGA